jgi:uridine kinase
MIELERQAAQVTRQPAAYTDVTVSFSKSISVFHASGAAAQYQRYDWPTGALAAGELHPVPRSGTVIVEGVYTARPELEGYYDLTVWVEAPREVCMQRLNERGHDHGPGNWNERWRAAEEYYFAVTQPGTRLDLTVRGC